MARVMAWPVAGTGGRMGIVHDAAGTGADFLANGVDQPEISAGDDRRGGQDDRAEDSHLRVLHVEFLLRPFWLRDAKAAFRLASAASPE